MATVKGSGEKGSGVIGAGSAALRKVMSTPLARLRGSSYDTPSLESLSYDDDGSLGPDASLNAIIEGEIIPKLLIAHGVAATTPKGARKKPGSSEISPGEAHRFALLPLQLESANLMEEIDGFLESGVSVEAIYLDLLAPTARKLGDMWAADECDFVDVTMGLWRLQEVMREIAARNPVEGGAPPPDAPRALFAPMPGDQHSFGALMIDEIFTRAGWRSTTLPRPLRKELLDTVSREPYDVLGLTLTRDCPSSAVANFITATRKVSANPHLSILIGGHMINQNPAIVAEVGADGTGADARAALDVAERLVQSAPVRAHKLR